MTEEFFSCIILSVPHIQGEVLQYSLHLYFQMLSLTSQPNSFYSPPLCLSLLCWHRVPIHSYPSYIWSFVFPIKGEIYSVHSYFLYFKPAFGGLQMNEGVEVVSARLSWDHLAHLIKHRSFNLAFSFQKTTSTSSSTTTDSSQHSHADAHKGTYTLSARIVVHQWHSDLVQEETFATHGFLVRPPDSPIFSSGEAKCVSFHWCLSSVAEPATVKKAHLTCWLHGSSALGMQLLHLSYILYFTRNSAAVRTI